MIKPIKHGKLNRKMANVELPYIAEGRMNDIIIAIIIENRTPPNAHIKLDRKYIIIEETRIIDGYLK
jgi:hypothetical protein